MLEHLPVAFLRVSAAQHRLKGTIFAPFVFAPSIISPCCSYLQRRPTPHQAVDPCASAGAVAWSLARSFLPIWPIPVLGWNQLRCLQCAWSTCRQACFFCFLPCRAFRGFLFGGSTLPGDAMIVSPPCPSFPRCVAIAWLPFITSPAHRGRTQGRPLPVACACVHISIRSWVGTCALVSARAKDCITASIAFLTPWGCPYLCPASHVQVATQ